MKAARPGLSVRVLVPVWAGRTRADALGERRELARTADEAGYARYVGRTCFKDTGDSRRLRPLEGMDAVAAGDVRRHESIAADDDAARPAWPVKRFMARKAGCRDDAIG